MRPAFSLLVLAVSAQAQEAPPQTIVVTGSVTERRIGDVPYSIDVVDQQALRSAGPLINLSEGLQRVPGLQVQNRNNYAQDLQISARGFGARAGFGVRGVRLYADGIPATMPDGQGQVAHFDLAGAQRVEVLRGPFSALYGNSSGGVIALVGAPVLERGAEAAADIGSFGLRQLRAAGETPLGEGWSLRGGASAMQIDGFRPHASAERQLATLRAARDTADGNWVFSVSHLHQPADDPLGLTREQFDADPYSTAPQATEFDTRKTVSQTQFGASGAQRITGAGALKEARLALYGGTRSVTQYLAIPQGPQGNPGHGGGVIDFDRLYGGGDGRLTWRWSEVELAAGATVETQRDDRQGYENFVGDQLGVRGALRRDEQNRATTTELYSQAEWQATEQLALSAGLRGGELRMTADDEYLSNGDDSGSLRYDYTNPVLGLRWKLGGAWTLRASAARGFESPTLGELAYRPDGDGGFNTALKPQKSRQYELGLSWRGADAAFEAALFRADVEDEIVVLTNAGGRSSFQNAGRTRRQGAELSASWKPTARWRAQVAAHWLDAYYRDSFLACSGTPCPAADTPVPAGQRLPGAARAGAWAELAWQAVPDGELGVEWRALGATSVNDLGTDRAAGYALMHLRWQQRFALDARGTALELLARAENVFDRVYAGGVIVNEGNGRFFEPGAPRNYMVGLRLRSSNGPARPSRTAPRRRAGRR